MKSNKNKYITLLASLGSTLEYYDFVIYGMMATYLSVIFFPTNTPATAALQAFLVFAVGYFARPLGGTIIGMIGDRLGRRPAFLISTSLMAVSTLLIALLPTYESFGISAIFLLVFLRITQGLSFGAELPGAITIVSEFSSLNWRGRRASFVMASTSLGALLASSTLFFLSSTLTHEDIISWGWRLPFLAGGILGLILLIARNAIQETPVFESMQKDAKERAPFRQLFKTHTASLFQGAALTSFMAAIILTNLYFPYYIPKAFAYALSDVYFGTTLSLIFVILVLPIMGLVSDILPNKTKTLQWTCASYIVLSIPIFSLLKTQSIPMLWTFLMIQQLYIALYAACFFPMLIQLFPPEIRYTGFALSYNLTWAILSMLPAAFTYLHTAFETPWVVPIVLSGVAGVSLIASWKIKEGA